MDFGFPLQILQDEYESCPSMTVDVKDAQGVYNINMPILQEILDSHGHHGLLLLEAPTALYAIFRGTQTLHWQYSGAVTSVIRQADTFAIHQQSRSAFW
jgi:hypothetical protein